MKTYRLPHHLSQPLPLALRAFALTKCSALHVSARFADVPFKVLPVHEREFRTFTRKVIGRGRGRGRKHAGLQARLKQLLQLRTVT
ncbi:hypothetical protein EDB86DRAFT_3076936 [Lactarius hatsudake]|nr:hypothetical protein EDB86DRAFT_3076936 [Lactarius hatsudake]